MMQKLLDLWAAYESTLAFAAVNAFFALSTYAVMATGILSFATVAFAAVGGFLGAQLMGQFGLPLWLVLPASAAGGCVASLVVSFVFLRLESHWLALASLALILITRILVLNAPMLTGGVNGLSVPIEAPLWLLLGLLAVVALAFWRLSVSWYGIAARAVREDPAVAGSLGIAPRRVQRMAFAVSGALGGLGGVLLAMTLQFLSPETYYINISFTMIAAVVLGGSYHWMGAIVGALVFTALPQIMQALVPQVQDLARGVALLLIMILLPRGLVDPRAWRIRRALREARR
jgi:branched-chain amino acid transport system permease protein